MRRIVSSFRMRRVFLAVSVIGRFTIGVSLGQQVVTTPPRGADSVSAGGTAEVERVIVTGSNIPSAEEVGPNPVLSINRDLIEKSGERTAEELIRNTTV